MFIARREFRLDLNFKELDEFFNDVQSSVMNEIFPKDYVVNILKDQIACCGVYSLGIAFEIEGPDKQGIKDLDLKVYSKVIENFERKGIEYHEPTSLDII